MDSHLWCFSYTKSVLKEFDSGYIGLSTQLVSSLFFPSFLNPSFFRCSHHCFDYSNGAEKGSSPTALKIHPLYYRQSNSLPSVSVWMLMWVNSSQLGVEENLPKASNKSWFSLFWEEGAGGALSSLGECLCVVLISRSATGLLIIARSGVWHQHEDKVRGRLKSGLWWTHSRAWLGAMVFGEIMHFLEVHPHWKLSALLLETQTFYWLQLPRANGKVWWRFENMDFTWLYNSFSYPTSQMVAGPTIWLDDRQVDCMLCDRLLPLHFS